MTYGREKLIERLKSGGGEYVLLPRRKDGRVDLRMVMEEVRAGDRVIMDFDGVVVPSCEGMLMGIWQKRKKFVKQPMRVAREEGRAGYEVLRSVAEMARRTEVVIWTSRFDLGPMPGWMGGICCFPVMDEKARERLERVGLRVIVGKPVIKRGSLEEFFWRWF